MDLGDIEAEHLQREFRVIDDPDVTAFLQRVGDRLVQHLPLSSVKYQFFLYDQPESNAFGLTGGRIYVSRKLVAFMKSEDELAALLGHELGHMAGHHSVIDMSTFFRLVLGVDSVGDHKDIFEKYNRLLDNFFKQPDVLKTISKNEEPDQIVADTLSLYLISAAGYDAQALINFWKRYAQPKGKSGGILSALFGIAGPDENRLRQMEAQIGRIPGKCGDSLPPPSPGDFAAWKSAVLNYSGVGHRESLHNVTLRHSLEPPLRGDTHHIRFSPDGKYILAQDDSSIYIITRDPFAPLFRIDAPEALPAVFSLDSQTVSFYTKSFRVETWNLPDQERVGIRELAIKNGCIQSELSPDGNYLACYGNFDQFDLAIYETSTDSSVFQKKGFYEPRSIVELLLLATGLVSDDVGTRIVTMRFSPDSHYFVAASHDDTVLALDMTTKKPVPLPGSIKKLLGLDFEFLAPDKLAGINREKLDKSGVVSFPQGAMIEETSLGSREIEAASHGNYILIRPVSNNAVGVLDLNTKKIITTSKESNFDIFENVAVAQRLDGELVIKQVSDDKDIAMVMLPRGPLAPLRAIAVSPDLTWLAISDRSRGGVWNLTSNQQVINARGFRGGYFGPDGMLYADFHGLQGVNRSIGKVNPVARDASVAYKLEDNSAHQAGAFLLVTIHDKRPGNRHENFTLDVRDTVSGKPLWTRVFPQEMPDTYVDSENGTIALTWSMSDKAAQTEIGANRDLAKRAQGIKKEEANLLVEVLDGRSGKYQGGIVVNTNKGSFAAADVFAARNSLLIGDSENRILVYSLATGEQTGKGFGHRAEVSAASGLVALENEDGQVLIYDLATMEKRDELRFTSPVSTKRFSSDGKRLFVLTASQMAYIIDVSSDAQPAAKSTPATQ
ncbi:MAG: M48 family metalloprotease [Candidatus Acidiferrales bacterium]